MKTNLTHSIPGKNNNEGDDRMVAQICELLSKFYTVSFSDCASLKDILQQLPEDHGCRYELEDIKREVRKAKRENIDLHPNELISSLKEAILIDLIQQEALCVETASVFNFPRLNGRN